MDFLRLAKRRSSVRMYADKEIADEDLRYILEAGRMAPSASNRQPWKFVVIREKENLEKVYELYHRAWFRTAPLVILVLADHSVSWKRPEDGKDHAVVDASIAIDHLTLAAAEKGIGSCWICNFYVEKTVEFFGLPGHLEPVAFLSLGYPKDKADMQREKIRKDLSEIVFYEKLNL